MELLLTISIHFLSTLLLFLLLNFLGEKTKFWGYATTSDILEEGNLGYNFLIRMLSPAIFISFLSICFYLLKLEFLIVNIWLIVVWHFVLRLLVIIFLNKFNFINKFLYLFTNISAIFIAYFFYAVALSRGLEFIVPDNSNFRTELWFIFFIYLYHLFNSIGGDGDYIRKVAIIKNKYKELQAKFQEKLKEEFKNNKFLSNTFFSLMITETISRPLVLRKLEKILFPLGFIKSTGIMQICSNKLLTDEESVELAQQKILKDYNTHKKQHSYNHELLEKIATLYNPDKRYTNLVEKVFQIIGENLYEQIDKERNQDKENLDTISKKDIKELGILFKQLSDGVKKSFEKENE